MAHDFYKKMHDLNEVFQKKELECLNAERKWNSAMIRSPPSLPQDYLRKLEERENNIKETYQNVMMQMDSFDKHIDIIFRKIEKLRIFKNNLAATEHQFWPSMSNDLNSQTSKPSSALDASLQLNGQTIATRAENEIQSKNFDFISSVTEPSRNIPGNITGMPSIGSLQSGLCDVSGLPKALVFVPSTVTENVKETDIIAKTGQLSGASPIVPSSINLTEASLQSIVNSVPILASNMNEPTDQLGIISNAVQASSLSESVHQTGNKSVSVQESNVIETTHKTQYQPQSSSTLPVEESPQKKNSIAASPVKTQSDLNVIKPTTGSLQASTATSLEEGESKKLPKSDPKSDSQLSKVKDREFDFLESETPKDSEDNHSQASSKRLLSPEKYSGKKAVQQENLKVNELDQSSSPSSTGGPSAFKDVLPGSDSDSSSERETPLKASAAYQALLGNIVPPQSNRKISDSDTEDEVEKALAKVVSKGSKKELPFSDAQTKKAVKLVPQTVKSPIKTTPAAALVSKPQSKLSSSTRKVLGLDSSGSEAELAVTASKEKNEDDSDEFDFFD